MELWHLWTSWLASGMAGLSAQFGLSEAMGIIAMTLLVRAGLMPFSLTAALRMEANKTRLKAIKPELDALKLRLKNRPAELGPAIARLYKAHGIRFFDRLALANIGSQSAFGIGIYQAIGKSGFGSPFLWIGTIARPDVWLTALVAVLMAIAMGIAPGAFAEPSMLVMMGVAVIIAVVSIAAMPSAVGLYWASSNVASVVQAVVLRGIVARRAAA
ncbi:hypothetical protein BH09PSE6_BH09PSE6_01790 [soil metagenome]